MRSGVFIVSFEGEPPFIRKAVPPVVRLETGPVHLLYSHGSDESEHSISGRTSRPAMPPRKEGVFALAMGLQLWEHMQRLAASVENIPEPEDCVMVLTVGLFDGIAALRVAADSLLLPMSGHVSCEVCKEGNRVVEAHFPDSIMVGNVESIDENMVKSWACQHANVGVVVVGGGPPCQGVSGLNVDRKGALKDAISSCATSL